MDAVTVVAKVFVLNHDNLIMVLRRSSTDTHRPLTWDLPGGGVDYGEDPKDAVIREAQEEAGLSIKSPTIVYTGSNNDDKYVIRLLYYTFSDQTEIKLSDEHDKVMWVTKDQFVALDLPDYFKEAVQLLPEIMG